MLSSPDQESDIAAMRRLMLLRHAKAERAAPGAAGAPDRDRRLNKRGKNDAPVIGAYMARHHLIPDLALVSPAARAEETWKLVAACFAKKARHALKAVIDERLYNAGADQLTSVIAETKDARSILVVGHNPGIQDLAVELIASGETAARGQVSEKLPTSGLVVIDVAFDDWAQIRPHAGRLERFVSPRLIEAATE